MTSMIIKYMFLNQDLEKELKRAKITSSQNIDE
jgi:hypothetical protein